MHGFGEGSMPWTAGPETVGSSALIRVTSGDCSRDVSDQSFRVANDGHSYYINDGSYDGDEYTTAVGDNANSGKDPAHPMASLSALVRAYDLDAGDVVYVDTGTYSVTTNIVLGVSDSGVRIEGPVGVGHRAVVNRGNTASTA